MNRADRLLLCLVLAVGGCLDPPAYRLPAGYSSTYHERLLLQSSGVFEWPLPRTSPLAGGAPSVDPKGVFHPSAIEFEPKFGDEPQPALSSPQPALQSATPAR